MLHVRQGQSAEAVTSFDVGHARVSCVTTSDFYDLKKRVNQSDGCYEIDLLCVKPLLIVINVRLTQLYSSSRIDIRSTSNYSYNYRAKNNTVVF